MANLYSSPSPALSPYVPTYDTDLLGKGLMYKQSQDEQNFARIQAAADKAAALEIYNPIQNKYLQGKLADMTTELNSYVSSGLANNAIVNNALNAAAKVYRDPIVREGLSSTQKIQSQYKDRKRLEKAGQYNEITKYHDDQEINRYINSTDLNDFYRGSTSATKKFDLKVIEDGIAAKNPDVEVRIDNYGKIERITDKSKTRTPDQIKGLIATEFANNPEAANYLRMVGEYNYRDLDGYSMLNAINNQIRSINDSYRDRIKAFQENTILNKLNASTNATVIAQLEAEQQAWTGYIDDKGQRVPGYYDMLKAKVLSGDLNGAKGDLQYQTFLTNAIQKYTVNDHDVSIDVPEVEKFAFERAEKDRRYALDRAEFEALQNQRMWERGIKEFELGVKYDKDGKVIVATENTPESGSYTRAKHQENAIVIDQEMNTATVELRKTWDKINASNPEYQSWDKNKREIEFQLYKRTQEKAYTNNYVNVDPSYKSWRKNHKALFQEKAFNTEVIEEVTKNASERYPIQGGRIFNELGLTINYNSPEADAINDVYTKTVSQINDLTSKGLEKMDGGQFVVTEQLRQEILARNIEQYRNQPRVYNALKQAAAKGFSKFTGQDFQSVGKIVHSYLDQVEQARQKSIDDQMETYGQNINDKNLIITNPDRKQELLQSILGLGAEILESSPFNLKTNPKKDNLGLNILSVGRRSINGKFYVRASDAEGNVKDVEVPIVNTERYVPNDPYLYIRKQVASRGNTSYNPAHALITDNGKISYVIDTDQSGTYVSILGPGGAPLRTNLQGKTIDQIVETMEVVSKAVDANKKPLTREEIINSLNNPEVIQTITINGR